MEKLLLILCLSAAVAQAAETVPADFIRSKIDPKAGLSEDVAAAQAGPKFFREQFKSKSGEVLIRATAMPNAEGGMSMARVETANIQNLYRQRRNPYEGQITEVVKCNPKLGPHVGKIKVFGQDAVLTCGGVNARKGFGACSKEEMVRWGCHFAVYAEPAGLAVDVRLYSADAGEAGLKKIREAAGNLFSR